jgi:hypothetical protein
MNHFMVLFDCGATVPQRDRLRRVEWPLAIVSNIDLRYPSL